MRSHMGRPKEEFWIAEARSLGFEVTLFPFIFLACGAACAILALAIEMSSYCFLLIVAYLSNKVIIYAFPTVMQISQMLCDRLR